MTDRYLRYIEYISQYMEDMGVDSYDLNFSSAFQEKIAKADNSPNQRKSREYSCALSLIDRFIQGLPYAAQRKKLKTYNFPSNELGDYANKFIEPQVQLASAKLAICLKNSVFGFEKPSFFRGLRFSFFATFLMYRSVKSLKFDFLGMY